MSTAMLEKDMRPNRHRLVIRLAQEFVTEFFEQNPISQLGIICMRDGIANLISDVGGNPNDHINALEAWRDLDPRGNPSLQNALEMARGLLYHSPTHGTREVLIIFGALLSSDPGDIHTTLKALLADRIRVSIVGLAAEVAICREICARTNGHTSNPKGSAGKGAATTAYTIALDSIHLKELIMASTTPPPSLDPSKTAGGAGQDTDPTLLKTGFPPFSFAPSQKQPSFCACHSRLTTAGYTCPQCHSKVCTLPIDCPACGLTLILSTHLARSYHHLFPLKNWVKVSWHEAARRLAAIEASAGADSDETESFASCFACLRPFPPIPHSYISASVPSARHQAQNGSSSNTVAETRGVSSESGSAEIGSAKHRSLPEHPTAATTKPALIKSSGTLSNILDSVQEGKEQSSVGPSQSSRYACTVCGNHFCVDCDLWSHESVHNCPGCQAGVVVLPLAKDSAVGNGHEKNGVDETNGRMDVD
jgi:transcription initiation factor TFIIH subunit 2